MMSSGDLKSLIPKQSLEYIYVTLLVIAVPADDLALSGAKTSAGTVVTKFRCCIWDWFLKGIKKLSYAP